MRVALLFELVWKNKHKANLYCLVLILYTLTMYGSYLLLFYFIVRSQGKLLDHIFTYVRECCLNKLTW